MQKESQLVAVDPSPKKPFPGAPIRGAQKKWYMKKSRIIPVFLLISALFGVAFFFLMKIAKD